MIFRISGRNFTARARVADDGRILDVSPILGQWRGEQFADLREYTSSHGWRLEFDQPAEALHGTEAASA